MKRITKLFILTVLVACSSTQDGSKARQAVQIETNFGTIVIHLYDETPLHRDNFLKLVNEQFYDSILFHRVIEQFMIQAGDPESRSAGIEDTVGLVDLPYTIPAEFHPDIFHKRGALGAARDNNPERASSSTQFYIVQGRVYNDSTLERQLDRINGWLAMNRVVNDPANKALVDELDSLQENDGDSDAIHMISDELQGLADADKEAQEPYRYPEAHSEHYKTIGGAAHLDQNYTVFGEVVEGMAVVDSIAAVATNDMDRPLEPVKILSTKIIEMIP